MRILFIGDVAENDYGIAAGLLLQLLGQSLSRTRWDCKYQVVRGYYVSTVGLDEAMVRAYIRNQEAKDECYDQMELVE